MATAPNPRIILNEQRLIGAVEMDLYQLIHMTHVEKVDFKAESFDWFWIITICVHLYDRCEYFVLDVHSQTTYESLALAVSFEAENINRWIEKNI